MFTKSLYIRRESACALFLRETSYDNISTTKLPTNRVNLAINALSDPHLQQNSHKTINSWNQVRV